MKLRPSGRRAFPRKRENQSGASIEAGLFAVALLIGFIVLVLIVAR